MLLNSFSHGQRRDVFACILKALSLSVTSQQTSNYAMGLKQKPRQASSDYGKFYNTWISHNTVFSNKSYMDVGFIVQVLCHFVFCHHPWVQSIDQNYGQNLNQNLQPTGRSLGLFAHFCVMIGCFHKFFFLCLTTVDSFFQLFHQ